MIRRPPRSTLFPNDALPIYPDKDRAIFGAFAKNLIPRGYLVGKDGKIIYTSKGYTDEEFAELMTKIEGALK